MKKICILGPDGSGKTTLIPNLCKELEKAGFNTASISSTKAYTAISHWSKHWREQLVSEHSTNLERFNAALCLYRGNLKWYMDSQADINLTDYLVIDRGGSSLVTYNRIRHENQFSLIPEVDFAIYVTSPFDVLTERLMQRKTDDFQDNDLEFRKHVYSLGESDFLHWLSISNTKGMIHDTSTNTSAANAKIICDFILSFKA